jgi:hypothetical protein
VLGPLTGHVEAVLARIGVGFGVLHGVTSVWVECLLRIEMEKLVIATIMSAIAIMNTG